MIYGTAGIRIVDDSTDMIGIRSLVLAQRWQASRPNMTVAELDAEAPAPPDAGAGVLYIGRQRKPVPGGLREFWTFEGISGSGKDVTFKGRTNSPDYFFDAGFSQVPIQLLDWFESLKNQFGGQVLDAQVIWPEYLAAQQSNGAVVGQAAGSPNPMFGITDFLRMEGTYSFRYAAFDTSAAQNGVGFIASELPGVPPRVQDGRNWLVAPPQWRHRGPVYDITETYWLSGPGGWPTPVYTKNGGGAQAPTNALMHPPPLTPAGTHSETTPTPRPAPGTVVITNRLGESRGQAPNSPTFDFCFRPALGGGVLTIGHGYVSSTAGDGPHAPVIAGVPLGGTTPAVLKLDPGQVNADGTSFAVLQVKPDSKGQITAQSVAQAGGLEIVHSKDGSPGTLATLGRKAITLILWSGGSPLRCLPLVHWNLQYQLVIPAPGNGAPKHYFF